MNSGPNSFVEDGDEDNSVQPLSDISWKFRFVRMRGTRVYKILNNKDIHMQAAKTLAKLTDRLGIIKAMIGGDNMNDEILKKKSAKRPLSVINAPVIQPEVHSGPVSDIFKYNGAPISFYFISKLRDSKAENNEFANLVQGGGGLIDTTKNAAFVKADFIIGSPFYETNKTSRALNAFQTKSKDGVQYKNIYTLQWLKDCKSANRLLPPEEKHFLLGTRKKTAMYISKDGVVDYVRFTFHASQLGLEVHTRLYNPFIDYVVLSKDFKNKEYPQMFENETKVMDEDDFFVLKRIEEGDKRLKVNSKMRALEIAVRAWYFN